MLLFLLQQPSIVSYFPAISRLIKNSSPLYFMTFQIHFSYSSPSLDKYLDEKHTNFGYFEISKFSGWHSLHNVFLWSVHYPFLGCFIYSRKLNSRLHICNTFCQPQSFMLPWAKAALYLGLIRSWVAWHNWLQVAWVLCKYIHKYK